MFIHGKHSTWIIDLNGMRIHCLFRMFLPGNTMGDKIRKCYYVPDCIQFKDNASLKMITMGDSVINGQSNMLMNGAIILITTAYNSICRPGPQ